MEGFQMKILLAPDSFKGSLDALEVCSALQEGIRRVLPATEIISVPMADGGEGTVQSLIQATGGRILIKTVTGPLGDPVEAFFGILGNSRTAVIEMSAASGLPLVPQNRKDPRYTTTYGTGELILAALMEGCDRILIGIGGSATNDGGAGMAQSLGFRLLDRNGKELPPGGVALKDLYRIDDSNKNKRIANANITVACDVTNVLTGTNGASAVYGPQKGATPDMVRELDSALVNFADVILKDLQVDIRDLPGGGAAGGLGAGLVAFTNAKLSRGVETVLELVQLKEKMQDADLVITGEGCIDGQTNNGKTPFGVAQMAKKMGLPVLAVAGSIGPEVEKVYGYIDGLISIMDKPMTLEQAIENAYSLVSNAGERLIRIYMTGKNH
jgi:glycerate kinase